MVLEDNPTFKEGLGLAESSTEAKNHIGIFNVPFNPRNVQGNSNTMSELEKLAIENIAQKEQLLSQHFNQNPRMQVNNNQYDSVKLWFKNQLENNLTANQGQNTDLKLSNNLSCYMNNAENMLQNTFNATGCYNQVNMNIDSELDILRKSNLPIDLKKKLDINYKSLESKFMVQNNNLDLAYNTMPNTNLMNTCSTSSSGDLGFDFLRKSNTPIQFPSNKNFNDMLTMSASYEKKAFGPKQNMFVQKQQSDLNQGIVNKNFSNDTTDLLQQQNTQEMEGMLYNLLLNGGDLNMIQKESNTAKPSVISWDFKKYELFSGNCK